MPKSALAALAIVLAILTVNARAAETTKTENLFFVMLDGVRWQEVFTGAEESLLNKERGGVANVKAIKDKFWRDSADQRRQALMPFLWNVIAKEGQLYGNVPQGGIARLANDKLFSYPGYSEILCGFPDDKITSNDKILNRNVTFLEWLHAKPEFDGRIAAFTSWDTFPFIINAQRSRIHVNAGLVPLTGVETGPDVELLNKLIAEVPLAGEEVRHDALTFSAAMMYLKQKKPRVMFISFDETDTQAHAGRYDRILASTNKGDGFIRELWETVQAMPEYQGRTSLIVTTDHGRGNPPEEWKSHGAKIAGAEYTWIGILGPDTPPLGERKNTRPVTQSQIAATAVKLLGYDYNAAVPQAGKPIADAVKAPE